MVGKAAERLDAELAVEKKKTAAETKGREKASARLDAERKGRIAAEARLAGEPQQVRETVRNQGR